MTTSELKGEAFDRARERGKERAEEITSGPEMITEEEVSKVIGMSRSIVDVCRQNGRLIGLPKDDGYCYPDWQLDKKHGVVVKGIKDVLTACDGCAWTAYRYLVETYPDEHEQTAYEKLRQGEVELILNHIGAIQSGVFT
ncbi:hypothetical protein [Sulfitobacter sp. R18_1]|uniref:hypothetical protein n=1 Tax=Sulfitobacter sp. R18_1 TaxID=2821104 RepID=UPI001ADB2093|nr:hypothetical protein [Sulfitobacter sp. R18_1]MBO9428823.1 hypothetical protein [Sulfitobacter sp. R18_1]